uniref:Uncharacterized protein n=1 Tax=Seriola lalandi dorsalis TaxID=1841481 RepID=A0A3B4WW38_SERLL
MDLVPLGRCDLLEQTFLQCDSLLPPSPPSPLIFLVRMHTDPNTNSAFGASSPVAAAPPPRSLSPGRFINRPQLLRPHQMIGLWPSYSTLCNSWREGGEGRTVCVSCYNHIYLV